jgi:hypothetical protein
LDLDKALDILKNMDEELQRMGHQILQLTIEQAEDVKEHNLAFRSLEHKVDKLVRGIGSNPQRHCQPILMLLVLFGA